MHNYLKQLFWLCRNKILKKSATYHMISTKREFSQEYTPKLNIQSRKDRHGLNKRPKKLMTDI